MQSLGGAVIPMQINTEKIDFLVGNKEILEHMEQVSALPMFSQKMMEFLADLSGRLMKDKRSRQYQDIMAYAYWIRKSSLETARKKHTDYENRTGRGVSFHIAPSNVPINFAVSMTSALLAGNAVVIRVSDKDYSQVDIVCDAMNELLSDAHKSVRDYICIVRYPHDDQITEALSMMCDIRIIWGGNETIRRIRQTALPPRSYEMTFADRHSIALIDSDYYLSQDADKVAKGFYTDTYYSDQNACSSPRLVVWFGDNIAEAKERFWRALSDLVKEQYVMQPVQAVDKYEAFCKLVMNEFGVVNEISPRLVSDDNYVLRVSLDRLTGKVMDYKCGGGYFFEYDAKDLTDIIPVLDKKCQTLAVLGFDKQELRRFVIESGVRGVDRIVDLGQTMGLEFVWDGYKMIETMTRVVYISDGD